MTLVLTTHYMDEAEQLCDRLVVMDKAKIVAEGSPRELIERHSTREVLEMRFPVGVQETLDGQLDGLGERVERLPDRVLVYADDGDAAAAAAARRGACARRCVLVRRSLARGRLPPAHRPQPGRLSAPDGDAERAPRPASTRPLVYRRDLAGQRLLARSSTRSSSWRRWASGSAARTSDRGCRAAASAARSAASTYLAFLAPGPARRDGDADGGRRVDLPDHGRRSCGTARYHGMLATPIAVRDLVVGKLTWIGAPAAPRDRRLLRGHGRSSARRARPAAFLAVPAAVLTGLAFAAPIAAFAATQENDTGFNAVFRFGVIPLFLFSGTFFPISQLPAFLQPIACADARSGTAWTLCRALAARDRRAGRRPASTRGVPRAVPAGIGVGLPS